MSGDATGLKLIVGYEMLVIQRAAAPEAHLTGARANDVLTITNSGTTNAELFQGQQCAPGGKDCAPLASHRVYAGAAVSVTLKPGFKAQYTVKVRDKVSTSTFE
jgi:hypothetical protein